MNYSQKSTAGTGIFKHIVIVFKGYFILLLFRFISILNFTIDFILQSSYLAHILKYIVKKYCDQ